MHGWAIREIPQVMIEAEFHAVWRDRDGTLIDVNPRRERETRITLVPAPGFSAIFALTDSVQPWLRP